MDYDEETILSQCSAMAELLHRDMDEDSRACQIGLEDAYLNQFEGLYLEVWRRLDAPTRSAWKKYVLLAKQFRPLKDSKRDLGRQG